MAGGALGGVFGAALRLFHRYREDLIQTPFYNNEPISQIGLRAACLWGSVCMSGSVQ